MICFQMGKTYTTKTSLGDFKVTTPENSLLSQQAVTSKGIPVPYTNLQLNPYPNIQLDLFCSDNISFSMHGSQYMTNQFWDTEIAPDRTVLQRTEEEEWRIFPWVCPMVARASYSSSSSYDGRQDYQVVHW